MEEAERLIRVRMMARSGEARQIRQSANLTLQEVADVIGVDVATVSRWEAGLMTPRRPHGLAWEQFLAQAAVQVATGWMKQFPTPAMRGEA